MNWLKLVYEPFGAEQNALDTQFLPRPARKESNVPKLKSRYMLTVLIYMYTVNTPQKLVANNKNVFKLYC